ncbi:MAG: hypothetical protein VX017_10785 [Pseudomonadota bacterium]|nr:hypothetical protein [Pseudomonadota bacterium]
MPTLARRRGLVLLGAPGQQPRARLLVFGAERTSAAAAAAIAPSAARALSGSITALILHQLARLDRQAVLESLADIEDAGEVQVRD